MGGGGEEEEALADKDAFLSHRQGELVAQVVVREQYHVSFACTSLLFSRATSTSRTACERVVVHLKEFIYSIPRHARMSASGIVKDRMLPNLRVAVLFTYGLCGST